MLNIPELTNKLIPVLTRRIKEYHALFDLPLIAELWEETLSKSLKESGYSNDSEPNRSHQIGKDRELHDIENSRISCKSGQFITPRSMGTLCVKFNGGRSTAHKELEDKIRHFSANHDDWYFLLAKEKKFNRKYTFIIFPSSACKVDTLTWSVSKSGKEWHGKGDFIASIGESMSSQLWTTFPLNMITFSYEIDCNL